MKHPLLAFALYFFFVFSCPAVQAQSMGGGRPFFAQSFTMIKFDYAKAYIKIDNKESSYSDLLKLHDSDMLKVELYPPKRAVMQFGKDMGANGVILFTTKKIREKPAITTTEDSAKYYEARGFNPHVKGVIYPTLDGDTTYKAWVKFLQKNLHADTPTERGAPMGLYRIMLQFAVNTNGSVSDITVDEDAGYGTKAEAKRVMSTSPLWLPGTYKGDKVKCYQREPITFQVIEM